MKAADSESGWAMLFGLGIVLVVVSFIDLGLLFIPPHWASLDWEFGTISAAVEGLPLLTVGLTLMAAASVANGRGGWTRTTSLVAMLMVVALLVMLAIFALDVPVAIRAVTAGRREPLYKAIAKTMGMAGLHMVWYLVLGIWSWRRARIKASGKGAVE